MKIGTITIGQSPRDDVIPEMLEVLSTEVDIHEKGALDDLSIDEIMGLHQKRGEPILVSRLRDGREVKVAKKHVMPRLSNCVRELEEGGAEILMLLCTGTFPEIETRKILLRPYVLMKSMVDGILKEGKLGVVVPSPDHVQQMGGKWGSDRVEVVVESVSPYTATDEEIVDKAKKIRDHGSDLILLDCIGFKRRMKAIFGEITKKPVLLPKTIMARIVDEMIEAM